MPTGSVTSYAGSTAPTGWLLCAGQAVSRSTYSSLFSVVSTTYGSGDGSTTFNLPDLRGRVSAGVDNMGGTDAGRLSWANTLGTNGGAQTHTLTQSEQATMPVYYGTLTAPLDNYGAASGGAGGGYVGNIVSSVNDATARLYAYGLGGAHNNMQPTILLNYIIKI
jgi:microcystin-dependent protein